MGIEIERKFLVIGDEWRSLGTGVWYRQGYLSIAEQATTRVRIVGPRAWLTIKGKSVGLAKPEFEYEIPLADAEQLLDKLCKKPLIEKKRYKVEYGGLIWEIDEFFGENQGLILAEVELDFEEQQVVKPEWVGVEVTGDFQYCNAALVDNPYRARRAEE